MRPVDFVTVAIGACFMLWGAALVPSTLSCLAEREAGNPAAFAAGRFPRLWPDLAYAAAACVIISAVRSLLQGRVLVPYAAEPLVRTDKPWTADERRAKVHKCATALFKGLCYHLPVSVAAYFALRDEVYLPGAAGGRAWPPQGADGPGARAIYRGLPHHELAAPVKAYYLVALGFALHSLLFHALVSKRRHDYWEMGLHHVVTVLLVLFSYAGGLHRIGALVLFLHDVPDIFVYLAKATADSKFPNACLGFYFGMVGSWGWCRLYVFPRYAIGVAWLHAGTAGGCSAPTFGWLTAMMILLLLLHIWWFTIFMKMGYDAIFKGVTRDLQSQDPQLQRELREQQQQQQQRPKSAAKKA